jgi:hypothetical protein
VSALPNDLPDGQETTDAQIGGAVGHPHPVDQRSVDPHSTAVDGALSPADSTGPSEPIVSPSRLADSLLLIYSDALDDLERTRIATENRVRSLRQVKGMGATPEEARLVAMVDGLAALEHGAELELKRALRKHPLGPWVKATVGVGEKQGARLLAAIGDPASRRTVSQLWAYSGYHVLPVGQPRPDSHAQVADGEPSSDTGQVHHETQPVLAGVAPSRNRGQKANWNTTAKMRAFLVAESCIKHRRSPYRAVYDAGREKYADSVHKVPCRRCGPSGHPAETGSPLSDGHKHARAMRLVSKAILRDIWVEARRVTDQGVAQ